jgi:hypothetical protein
MKPASTLRNVKCRQSKQIGCFKPKVKVAVELPELLCAFQFSFTAARLNWMCCKVTDFADGRFFSENGYAGCLLSQRLLTPADTIISLTNSFFSNKIDQLVDYFLQGGKASDSRESKWVLLGHESRTITIAS